MDKENKSENQLEETIIEDKESFNGNKRNHNKDKAFYKRIWFWVLVVIAVVGVGGTSLYAEHLEVVKANQILSEAKAQQIQNDKMLNTEGALGAGGQSVSVSANNENVLTGNLNSTKNTAKATDLKAGTYTVGQAIESGYYEGTFTGTGQVVIKNSKGEEILNANIEEGSKAEKGTLKFQLDEGNTVTFTGFTDISLAPYTHKYLTTLNSGSYTVGQNIRPGEYKVEVPSGTGSLSVYDAMGFPVFNEMATAGQNQNNGVQNINLNLKAGYTVVVNGINGVKLNS